MSNSAKVVVLYEDVMHDKLIRRFLERKGFNVRREVRFEKSPVGKTQNNGFIFSQYADQVRAIRSRFHRVSCALVVWIDGDEKSIFERRNQLDNLLLEAGMEKRSSDEAIAVVVPMRNVETWYWFLRGNEVNEVTNYKYNLDNTQGAEEARVFARLAVGEIQRPANCPPALILCIEEELPRVG